MCHCIYVYEFIWRRHFWKYVCIIVCAICLYLEFFSMIVCACVWTCTPKTDFILDVCEYLNLCLCARFDVPIGGEAWCNDTLFWMNVHHFWRLERHSPWLTGKDGRPRLEVGGHRVDEQACDNQSSALEEKEVSFRSLAHLPSIPFVTRADPVPWRNALLMKGMAGKMRKKQWEDILARGRLVLASETGEGLRNRRMMGRKA